MAFGFDSLISVRKRYTSHFRRRHLIISLFSLTIAYLLYNHASQHYILPPTLSPPLTHVQQLEGEPPDSHLHLLLSRQSTTLLEAESRYKERTGLNPPLGFNEWFDYAQKHSCLIDDYERITQDFKPFVRLIAPMSDWFGRRIHNMADLIKSLKERSLSSYRIRYGRMTRNDAHSRSYFRDLNAAIQRILPILPPVYQLTPIFSSRDQPRILFLQNSSQTLLNALRYEPLKDPHPFGKSYPPDQIAGVLREHCAHIPHEYWKHAFFQAPTTNEFATDFTPLLSTASISTCFSDILVPSPIHYQTSTYSPKYRHRDNIPWREKKSQLFWRGDASGGKIYTSPSSPADYHDFARFRLIDISRSSSHSGLYDVAITNLPQVNCDSKSCDRNAIIKEYNITHKYIPRERVYAYKYVMDVDGNSFSGDFLSLLKSGSLVFKSTLFTEYISAYLVPWVHYIPISPVLSDLEEKLLWAISHEEEAQKIQAAGKRMAERVLTDWQHDCYLARVLLEWMRVDHYEEINWWLYGP